MAGKRTEIMKFYYYVFLLLPVSAMAQQQPDSLRAPIDSAAFVVKLREFNAKIGPAEHVFSLINIPIFGFNSGAYRITDRDFPLIYSPDSLVRIPTQRAHRQSRIGFFSSIASVVPLVVLSYSVVRLAAAPLTTVSGQPYPRENLKPVIVASGVTALVGIVVSASFNIASLINSRKAIRQHNQHFGRRVPTLFNPGGL